MHRLTYVFDSYCGGCYGFGPAIKDDGEVVTIGASIVSVTPMRRCDLTDTHAQRDGFTSLAEMHEALNAHYPGLRMNDPVDVVTFELST